MIRQRACHAFGSSDKCWGGNRSDSSSNGSGGSSSSRRGAVCYSPMVVCQFFAILAWFAPSLESKLARAWGSLPMAVNFTVALPWWQSSLLPLVTCGTVVVEVTITVAETAEATQTQRYAAGKPFANQEVEFQPSQRSGADKGAPVPQCRCSYPVQIPG